MDKDTDSRGGGFPPSHVAPEPQAETPGAPPQAPAQLEQPKEGESH